jgi:hypothetical protein
MMNTHEQRVREFAYQIWESEGRPAGHAYRHWEIACKLADAQNDDEPAEKVTGHIPSTIAPEEPFNPEPAPEIDPAPPQPGQPTPPAHPNIPPHPNAPSPPNVPVDPISPTEPPPHISPTPPPQPIHPTDPVQPGNPAQPIQPYASMRTSAATKSALKEDGVKPAEEKKRTKSRKARAIRNQDSISL